MAFDRDKPLWRVRRSDRDWQHWQAGLLVPALVVGLSILAILPGLWF